MKRFRFLIVSVNPVVVSSRSVLKHRKENSDDEIIVGELIKPDFQLNQTSLFFSYIHKQVGL